MSSAFPISGSRVANEQSNAFFIVWFFVFRGWRRGAGVWGKRRLGQPNECVSLNHAHGKMAKQPVCNIAGRQVAFVLVFFN